MRQTTFASDPQFLLIEEAAEIARASVATVRFWISTGRLRARRPGRRVLIRRRDLIEFLDGAGDDSDEPRAA
jgi:excisionase family DNA binding protein